MCRLRFFNPAYSLRLVLRQLCFTLIIASTLLAMQPAAAASTDLLKRVLDRGELRVGISLLPPWIMKDKDGNYTGFEIDVANQLARDMGVKVVFHEYEWKKMIPALMNNEVDILATGLSITPKRALKIAFSDPYSSSGYSLVTNLSLTRDFTSIDDLNNKKVFITAVAGSVSAELAEKIFPQASMDFRKTTEDASSAVINGTVHAFVSPSPVPEFISLKHPDAVDLPLNDPLLTTREAFAINHGNQEMLNFLNAWITAHKADKWLKSTHDYWFKSLKWQRHVEDDAKKDNAGKKAD
jgi:polar amino acid transport system substrate-binding protein